MTTTMPCPEVQQWQALALGKIAEADAHTLRLHLHDCGACSALAATLIGDPSPTDHLEPQDVHATRYVAEEQPAPSATPVLPSAGATAPASRETHSFLSPPVEADELGRLGPYRVLRLLGRGGMGMVFQAEDGALRRPVAIKILKQELADQSDFWDRFLREARTLASIKHEHVVTVYHSGQEGQTAYLVMELLQGCSLAEHLTNIGQAPVAEILRLGRELAAGLAVVHGHGLIHRDIKPANVWVEAPHGRVKILDFGLARQFRDDARLTQTGVVVGTPAYMSPEQARGIDLDPRSDLFSLGCILYRLCTGIEPFRGTDTMSLLMALAVDVPRPIAELNAAIPPALAELVMHLLAKNPAERPATATAVVARLEALERSPQALTPAHRSADITPLIGAGKNAVLEGPHHWTPLRVSLLLGGGLLAGVFAGLFALQTAAEPTRTVKEKNAPVAEAPPEKPSSADPEWQVRQRNQPVVAQVPKDHPRPAQPVHSKQEFREYLSDWQPIAVVGWPPEPAPLLPQGIGVPPPPPGPNDRPPGGPNDRPMRGGRNPPPLGEGPRGALHFFPMLETSPLSFPIISVNGKVSAHGIGMHANPKGKVSMSYALDQRFDTFIADVALNDTSPRSPVGLTFSVYGDGQRLWRSLPVMTRGGVQTCKVAVKGVRVLELAVTNTSAEPAALLGAHSVWLDPQVIGQK